MNYWMVCLPRLDLEHCIKVGKFGRNQKWILGRVRQGDRLVCLASKEWRIIAMGSVTSDYYMDTEPCFLKDGLFPDRFDFGAEKVKEVELMKIIDRLSFVKNLAYWAVYFRNGIVQMQKEDWELILNETETSITQKK